MLAGFEFTTSKLFVILVFGIPVIAIICEAVQKIAKVWSDNHLKRSMLERGMTVDEIERVLAAGTNKWHETVRKLSDDELKRAMIDRGLSAPQVDQMLRDQVGGPSR